VAIDSFLGYAIFRSPKFKERLIEQGIKLHLVDDHADYKKRIETLNKGDTPLALFTIDALIANSAALDSAPAAIVMMVDESRGADAIVGSSKVLANLGAMNRKDIKIVLTPDSPSDTLARVVRSRYLPNVPSTAFEAVEDDEPTKVQNPKSAQEKILDRFKASLQDPSAPPAAYVLWQPYVSMALGAGPDAQILVDSSHCPGYIVDVLVAQKAYLNDPKKGKEHREQVKKIIQAYLDTVHEHQADMAKLLREDWQQMVDDNKFPKTLEEEPSKQVAAGIRWKNTADNYAHFGVKPDSSVESIDQTITRIMEFLAKAGVISKKLDPKVLYDAAIWKDVGEGWSAPRERVTSAADTVVKVVSRQDCEEVAGVPLDPIGFQRGSERFSATLAEVPLKELAALMRESPRYYLEITGHAVGEDNEANRDLARKRAQAVRDWLQNRENGGLAPERIFTTISSASQDGKSAVSFRVLQKKEKNGR
jgi:outer membrane protein OmpA-like peptidoglycan-associated protein